MINLSGLVMTIASTSSLSSTYASALQAYMTRPEGFEIVQLGTSNPQGFYNSFYVLAPGILDQTHGQVIVDQNIVGVTAALADGSVTISTPGRLLNASLQPVITMRIGCLTGDIQGSPAMTPA